MARTTRKTLIAVTAAVLLTGAAGTAAATGGSAGGARDGGVSDRPALDALATASRTTSVDRALKASVAGVDTLRFAGADRYSTAVDISTVLWPDYADVVYVSNGYATADALAIGPSTAHTGPLLFVDTNTVPEVTRAEVARLAPCFIVVVGGGDKVSDAVAADLDQYADSARCGY